MTAGRSQRLSPVVLQSSIGLLILVGIGVLGGLLMWLKDVRFGARSYQVTFLFRDAAGMLPGTRVDYRGVRIGRVVSVDPGPEGVAVKVDISPADRLISSQALVQSRQSGLIGESSINIVPTETVLLQDVSYLPLDKNCDPSRILCQGSVLKGEDALDVDTLIRSLMRIANFVSQPQFAEALTQLAATTPTALAEISQFSREGKTLLRQVNRGGAVGNLNRTLTSVDQTAQDLGQLSRTATGTLQSVQASGTVEEVRRSLQSIQAAAQQVQGFLAVNDERLGATLVSLQGTSAQLQTSLQRLEPPLTQLLTDVNDQQVVDNLTQSLTELRGVATSAQQLTQTLNQFGDRLNDPQTILLLQQLLESARAAVQNLEKVTADVDQITGDPALRQQLIRLIQGLSNLVSSTDYLQRQVHYAQQLNQLSEDLAILARAYDPPVSPGNARP